ncbi:MAG: DUF3347 domain-containing protein [Myxococcales bacterium]|nr:DUF3347 domain-containing protein [Myxococcales bacterium]
MYSFTLAHPLTLVLPFALGLALACGGSTTPTPPPPPPLPVAPAAPVVAAKTFDQAAFQCCNADRAERLVDKYLDIEAKLYAGQADHLAGQYTALNGIALGAIDKGGFGADDNAILKRIAAQATADGSKDLAGKRSGFKALSTDVIAFARNHSGSGSHRIAQARCPMFEGGADWLQKESIVTNPYYGASMSNCGTFQ